MFTNQSFGPRRTSRLVVALGFEQNVFRADSLFSYQPTPGTVIFAGYGSTLSAPQSLPFRRLRRLSDGFFMKVSYLFRM